MERLARVACYFRWMRNSVPPETKSEDVNREASTSNESKVEQCEEVKDESVSCPKVDTIEEEEPTQKVHGIERYGNVHCTGDRSKRLCGILESILLWENSVNSISVVVVFNILFWGIIVLEVRGFAAASSAALVIVLCYSTLEAQVQRENNNRAADFAISNAKAEQIDRIGKKVRSAIESLKQLRKEQPGVFCTAVCSLSLGLWIISRTVNGVLLAYTICMTILLGPALLFKLPQKVISHKEWDSEIEEFLPAVTEDNLQVLTRAGESGDPCPTPPSVSEAQNEFFTDEDLMGLKMPSHEDSSSDGVEVSELELSEEADVDGIKFQSGHFEKGSSSEEEAELELSKKLLSHSDESGSEFEIIDSHEVDDLNVA